MSELDIALVAQAMLWLIVLGIFLASRQATVFHPLAIYLGFHALVFVLRPMLVQWLHFNHEWIYMGIEPSDELQIRVLIITSVGLLVYAGMALGFGWTRTEFKTLVPAPFTSEQRLAFWWTAAILSPVLLYSMYESHTNFAMENRGGTFITTGAGGYTIEAQYMAGPLICAMLALTRFRWYAIALLVPYVGYRAYSGMSRWTFVLLIVALGLIYAWHKRLKWVPWWLLLCMIALFPMFKALGDNRLLVKNFINGEQTQVADDINPGASDLDRFRSKYDGPDFANYDFLTFVVAKVPDRTGTYTYGSQYLQLFTEPIPRKLWPGKPTGAPIGFFNLNNYGNFTGRTPSLIGDGWMSGGWIGLVVTLGIVGGILGAAHRWFWKHSEDNAVALFYLVGLAMLPQWFRDGGISIAKFFFWNLSPLGLWLGLTWLFGRRLVPVASVVLARGSQVRLVRGKDPGTSGEPEICHIVVTRAP